MNREGGPLIKALTLHRPWCWAIVTGHKSVENRSWATNHRGPLLIHSGKTWDRHGAEAIAEVTGVHLPRDQWPTGRIVGLVQLSDCVRYRPDLGAWAYGPWCWLLTEPLALQEPVACRGQRRLWVPDRQVLETIWPQIGLRCEGCRRQYPITKRRPRAGQLLLFGSGQSEGRAFR